MAKVPWSPSIFRELSWGLPCSVLPSIVRVLLIQGKYWSPTHAYSKDLTCPKALHPVGFPFSQRPVMGMGHWQSCPGKDSPFRVSFTMSASAPRVRQPWGRAAQVAEAI